jgi:hypothetical protein
MIKNPHHDVGEAGVRVPMLQYLPPEKSDRVTTTGSNERGGARVGGAVGRRLHAQLRLRPLHLQLHRRLRGHVLHMLDRAAATASATSSSRNASTLPTATPTTTTAPSSSTATCARSTTASRAPCTSAPGAPSAGTPCTGSTRRAPQSTTASTARPRCGLFPTQAMRRGHQRSCSAVRQVQTVRGLHRRVRVPGSPAAGPAVGAERSAPGALLSPRPPLDAATVAVILCW